MACRAEAAWPTEKSALLVEVPRGISADRETTVRIVMPTRTARGFRMHLSPIYTRMDGEWLRYAKSTSQN